MKYFGTDGFRGEANVTLNVEHAYKVGRFLGNYFQKEDHKVRVVIGKDTRLSGYMFETALASGLTASGADVYELHVTTTPSVSYLVRKENFDCGIMISASHNPYFDNGIKVINGKGHKLEPEIEEQIEKYIDGESEEIPMAKREAIGRCFDYTKGRDEYIEYLKDLVKEPFDGKTVALDLANGSASMIAKEIFESMGAQVIARHDEPNGTNINRECGSTHIEVLQALVYDTGADIGFAYDGDADRCLAVDDDGAFVHRPHARNGVQRRGFSCAVAADDCHKVAVIELDVYAVERLLLVYGSAVESLFDVDEFKHYLSSFLPVTEFCITCPKCSDSAAAADAAAPAERFAARLNEVLEVFWR